ncbi:DUF3168 domain-containing protein [Sandaracinobacter sp.]|uniref:DUF3168 domain-containing protein n=1 Tax=Sandaracinobacter sp. TaxID=2487581 RepID=UPI0035B15D7E
MRASLELQRLVAAALMADAHVQARGIPTFDGPPANARPPYLSIGGDTVTAKRWQGGGGTDHRFVVSLWDNRESLATAKEILSDVERAVLAMPPAGGGLRLIGLRLVRGSVRRTSRNWLLGQLEFRTLAVMEN